MIKANSIIITATVLPWVATSESWLPFNLWGEDSEKKQELLNKADKAIEKADEILNLDEDDRRLEIPRMVAQVWEVTLEGYLVALKSAVLDYKNEIENSKWTNLESESIELEKLDKAIDEMYEVTFDEKFAPQDDDLDSKTGADYSYSGTEDDDIAEYFEAK